MSQEQLKENVKKWLLLNKQTSELKKKLRELNDEKKTLTKYLTEVMSSTGTDSINTRSGKVVYTKQNVRKTINKKYLAECLKKFITNETHFEEVFKYIYDNREIKVCEDIKLKSNGE